MAWKILVRALLSLLFKDILLTWLDFFFNELIFSTRSTGLGGIMLKNTRIRDARNGQFVKDGTEKRRPATTVKVTVKKPTKKK